MPLSIEPEQHSTTHYTAGATTHVRMYTHILKHAYSHTNANTKAQTNIDLLFWFQNPNIFLNIREALKNDYFS